jgi:hypothetical protein
MIQKQLVGRVRRRAESAMPFSASCWAIKKAHGLHPAGDFQARLGCNALAT